MKNNLSQDYTKELHSFWEKLKNKNFDASLPGVAAWIKKNSEAAAQEHRMRSRNKKRFQLSFFVVLFSLSIFSCTYRVERLEKFGDLIYFSLATQDHQSLLRLSSLQQAFNFKFSQFQKPDQPKSVSFISLIREDDKKVKSVHQELSSLISINQLDITPVEYTVKESLFLTFVHETLNIPGDLKPNAEELKKSIETKLKNKGIENIDIEVLVEKEEPLVVKLSNQTNQIIPDSSAIPTNTADSTELVKKLSAAPPDSITRKAKQLYLKRFKNAEEHDVHLTTDHSFLGYFVGQEKLSNGAYEITLHSKEENKSLVFVINKPLDENELKLLPKNTDNIAIAYRIQRNKDKVTRFVRSVVYLR